MKPQPKTDLLQGTLDLLILRTLASGDMHGWGISQRLQQLSRDVLQVNQGSLYPALYRLEQQGWIESSGGDSENNGRAKFYRLTKSGRTQLAEETATWERITEAVARIAAKQRFAGLGLGLAGALLMTRIGAGLLCAVEPTDPTTSAAVIVMLAAGAALAYLAPASRAAAIDPMRALRAD